MVGYNYGNPRKHPRSWQMEELLEKKEKRG